MPGESAYLNGERLPPGITITAAGTWRVRCFFRGEMKSKSLKLPLTEEGLREACRLRQSFQSALRNELELWEARATNEERADTYRDVFAQARRRARKKGREYTITPEQQAEIVERSGECCALTGVPFVYTKSKFNKRPFAPSLDRIDSSGGYTPENVRLICNAVNMAMNEWGEDVLATIAYGYIFSERRTFGDILPPKRQPENVSA